MNNIEQFFYDIFQNKIILFRCLKNKSKTIDTKGFYNKLPTEKLQYANDNNYEIYFVINTGGYKDKNIKQFNAIFIDLDCGRDKNKNYLSLEVVQQYKKEKLIQLNNFKLKPSYILETRNGLHIYWLLEFGATLKQFVECEEKLINYFNADVKVKNPSNLMRVPGYYWCKDIDNRYLIKIKENNNVKYNINDIIQVINDKQNKRGGFGGYEECFNYTIVAPKTPLGCYIYPNINIEYIMNKNIYKLQEILNPKDVTFYTREERDNYLKHQNLYNFLGVKGNKFKCIFHQDEYPSAGIIINKNTGDYIYSCMSSNCGFKANIFKCVERILNCSKIDAINFLCDVYKVKINKTEYQLQQEELLEENIRYLGSSDFEIEYPELYRRIKNYLPLLSTIIEIAKINLPPEHYNEKQKNALFFASLRHVAKIFGQPKNFKKIGDRIGLFTYLGLINKLTEENIPEYLLRRANKEAIELKNKNGIKSVNRISFFDIPSYCYEHLDFGEQKAIEFKNNHFTMKGWSREMLLRSLGENEANRVFPQMKSKKISNTNEKLSQEIEKSILELINERKWTTEKDALDIIKWNKHYKEIQIKKILGDMLNKYNLERVRLNKELKEKYSIDIKGYPYIIIKNKGA